MAVFVTFAASGVAFTSWVTRTPDIRESLDVTNGQIGWIIFGLSAGSIAGLTISGQLTARRGAKFVVAIGASLIGSGIVVVGVGTGMVALPVLSVGMIATGIGFGLSEVALNIEGAALETVIGRSVLPALHGSYSLGSLGGAALGALAQFAHVPVVVHLGVLDTLAVAAPVIMLRFLPAATGKEDHPGTDAQRIDAQRISLRGRLSVWTEPRTLLVGGIVLGMAFSEGAANDWLPLALVDGYAAQPVVASICFGIFVGSMTIGRLVGGRYVDRFGRVAVLRSVSVVAVIGILLVIASGSIVLVGVGCALWGLGVSLGFPLGISAAADVAHNAAARVSAVATLGYLAFLVGPPVLGILGERFGLLRAFLVVLALMAIAGLLSHAARPPAMTAFTRLPGSRGTNTP